MNEQNPNGPATKRQTFALFCATKKDYRDANLTYQQASDMLRDLNSKSGYSHVKQPIAGKRGQTLADELLEYMKDNSEKVMKRFTDALGLQSVVRIDTSFSKDDGKRYPFFGFGCGFAWLKYDKRSKRMKDIDDAYSEVHHRFNDWFIDKWFSKDYQSEMIRIGAPLQAIMAQDVEINSRIMQLVVDFADTKGVKGAWVQSRLD